MLDLRAKSSGLIHVMCEGTSGGTSCEQPCKERRCFKETGRDQYNHLYRGRSVSGKCICVCAGNQWMDVQKKLVDVSTQSQGKWCYSSKDV